MTAPIDNSLVADPQGLSALKRDAKAQSPESLRAAARQFEGLFTQMLLKSMRSATPQDSLFGSDQQAFYQDMFDTQLSGELSKGRGLGLADMLVQQLMKGGVGGPGDAGDAGDASRTAPSGSAMALPPIAATPSAPGSREAFVAAMRPAAERAAAQLGVSADTLIAHAALETGWGRSMPRTAEGGSSFNLFGIKAGTTWDGSVAANRTREVEQGRDVQRVERFRAYGSADACLEDYVRLIGGNPRYAGALNTGDDAGAFAAALQRGGYATDPDYARKLGATAQQLKSDARRPIADAGSV